MIHIYINGTHKPLKSDGATPKDQALWKRTDPISLLRKCLGNQLRSKHWRIAHRAKKDWVQAAQATAHISGDAVEDPATVVIEHCIPGNCDIDAPIKVILDAFQEQMFTTRDDSAIQRLHIRRIKPLRATKTKPGRDPFLKISAFSDNREWEALFNGDAQYKQGD